MNPLKRVKDYLSLPYKNQAAIKKLREEIFGDTVGQKNATGSVSKLGIWADLLFPWGDSYRPYSLEERVDALVKYLDVTFETESKTPEVVAKPRSNKVKKGYKKTKRRSK